MACLQAYLSIRRPAVAPWPEDVAPPAETPLGPAVVAEGFGDVPAEGDDRGDLLREPTNLETNTIISR